jgi:hypothetical protein
LYTQQMRKAAMTVPNYLLASFASLGRSNDFAKTVTVPKATGYGPDLSGRPFNLEIFDSGAAPLDSLVGVDCNDILSIIFLRDYNYKTRGLSVTSQGDSGTKTDQFDIRTV